ncbi:MAG TPA: SCP2 sterol-binding domain-containing protein [Acidimicrobiales bacterium]|nr:SCP2 sterol-binding domain-containing protein [Acidimicrobiales bacterium]
MARFLSAAWFDDLAEHDEGRQGKAVDGGEWVVEQVVTGTPEGAVRYQVAGGRSSLDVRRVELRSHPEGASTHLTFTSDYQTAAAIARGELSTQAALLEGRIRVSGDLASLADHLERLAGVDLVPAPVRASTTY